MGCPVSVVRREWRISQPQLKIAAEISRLRLRGITYRHLRGASPPLSCVYDAVSAHCVYCIQRVSSGALCKVPEIYRAACRSALLPFLLVLPSIQTVLSAPDFHRFGLSCGRASLAESWRPVRMRRFVRFFACLREWFAGCDRRFGISPTPEHDVDIDYATAHAGGLICFLWDNFRDKMTFCDCVLSMLSILTMQLP